VIRRLVLTDTPLVPSPGRGRSLLRHELLHPQYHDANPVQQVRHWLVRALRNVLHTASGTSPLGTFGVLVVFAALLLLVILLLSRARRSTRRHEVEGAVLTREQVTAAQLRARAAEALAAGRAGDAVVDGFRALTLRQIERGRLDDQPGATAHEVAGSLGTTYAGQRGRIDGSAALFDLVLYGDRPATADQAQEILALDDELAVSR
jgi:hypothetical protein